MKRIFQLAAFMVVIATPALAQSYSPYNPAGADTSDPGSAPLLSSRGAGTFTPDAAAKADTSDPGSAPRMPDATAGHRRTPNDPAGRADTSDPGSVHTFRN
jgi:hypothetical protein